MNKKHFGTCMVLLSASGFATLAIFIKFAYLAGVNSLTMLTVRFFVASVFLYLIAKLRGLSLNLAPKEVFKLFLMGTLGYGLMSLLFAKTLFYLPASISSMLLYLYPALVTVLSVLVGDETFNYKKGISLTVCFVGLFLVLGVSLTGLKTIGVLLGIGAALVYSLYIVAGNKVLKQLDSYVATTYVCASSALLFLLASLSTDSLIVNLPLYGWLSLLGMAFFSTVVGIWGLFTGIKYIGATSTSIISTLEPVITVILSFGLLGEKISPTQAVGGLIIVIGIIILELWGKTPYTLSTN